MFSMSRKFWICALIAIAVGISGGCDSGAGKPSGGTGKATKKDDHGHDHDHDHDHDHAHAAQGPHKGHIIELGEEEYHAEWTHDDESGLVAIYILDKEMKKEVAIESKQVEIKTKIGDAEKMYQLDAEYPAEGDMNKTAKFVLEDKSLITALLAAGKEGATATLNVEIEGKKFSAAIDHDAEHKH
jgi:hypothetical protein